MISRMVSTHIPCTYSTLEIVHTTWGGLGSAPPRIVLPPPPLKMGCHDQLLDVSKLSDNDQEDDNII